MQKLWKQENDTHVHCPLKHEYHNLEAELMLSKLEKDMPKFRDGQDDMMIMIDDYDRCCLGKAKCT